MRKSTEAHSTPLRLLRAAMPVSASWSRGSGIALRLSPLLLLAAALMASAVFFWPGAQPAGAQQTAVTVWTGALTAQTTAASTYGCDNKVTGKDCVTTSVLDDYDFTHGGNTYDISKITVSSGTLALKFGQNIPADLKAVLALDVDGKRFYLSEGGSSATDYTWSDTGLTWTQGSSVSLSLSILPLEIVFHHFATLVAKDNEGALGCSDASSTTCADATNLSSNSFSYNGVTLQIKWVRMFPQGTLDFGLSPVAQASKAEGLTLRLGIEKTVNGVKTVEYRSFNLTSTNNIGNGNFRWRNTGISAQQNANVHLVLTSGRHFSSLTFDGATIDDKTFTAGAPAPKHSLSLDEVIALKLPMATGGGYLHTYTAMGLPAGLSVGYDLVIRGTPEAATASPATVTYTVTDEANNTDSLTFNVSVAPPVVFDEDERLAFVATFIEYTVGQTGRLSHTLPSASGGHGGLTYHLAYAEKFEVEGTILNDVPGFSFDSATRVLTSDAGAGKPSESVFYAIGYSAVDANGGRADVFGSLAVRPAPTLPEIADQSFNVGATVSITLPKAEDGSLGGRVYHDYALSPEVEGLTFTSGSFRHRMLSGTPRFPGSTEMTYTVTDANGVSDTETFTINVANGPSAPTTAPTSLYAAQAASQGTAAATWDAVAEATEYVVQVRADDGSYPDKPVNSAPDGVVLSVYSATRHAVAALASDGDYKVRVAARNADGAGPWSAEVSFTVKVGGI